MKKAKPQLSKKEIAKAQDEACRLDKWLWAARFFKTRSLAKSAIDGGKVRYDGARVKSSRLVKEGALLEIKKEAVEKTVVVDALSVRRGSATQAALLYTETQESIDKRLQAEAMSKAQWAAQPDYGRRPDKSARRQIHRFKNVNDSDDGE